MDSADLYPLTIHTIIATSNRFGGKRMTTIGKDLDRVAAHARLTELAKTPCDLSAPDCLTPERIEEYQCRAANIDLLYATQRINSPTLEALQQLADESEVIDQFLAMKKGAVLNRINGHESENRQVLHTACRDIFSSPAHAPEASKQATDELAKLHKFLGELESGALLNNKGETFTDLIHIGIGGSDLGPRALYIALDAHRLADRQVHFISNVDPDDAQAVLQGLDLSRTLVNVVSKSGSTLETLTNEELVRAAYKDAGLEPNHHFLSVTGTGSPMDNPDRYLRSFYMFDYIGGRYSATSMVGAVMLGFALGYDAVIEILRGANDMDRASEEREITSNPALMLALLCIWNHNYLDCETLAVLPYSQALLRFPAHLQQCEMESNGKSITRNGEPLRYPSAPILWGEPGTNGQHAFYQLIHQGTAIVPAEFIGFRQSQYEKDILIEGTTSQDKLLANLLAQSLALATGHADDNPNKRFAGNRPSSIIITDRLTPYSLGALLALYEAKIVMQGFLWNINSFDQEGVQLGKKLAIHLLEHIASHRTDRSYHGGDTDKTGWAMLKAAGLVENKTTKE